MREGGIWMVISVRPPLGSEKPSRVQGSILGVRPEKGENLTLRMKSFVGIGTALLMALMVAVVALPVDRADAAKLTACVNKKTGAVKMVFGNKAKKKCPKGYKKVTWDSQSGSKLSVYGADGKRVGRFLGILPDELPIFQVERNGGIYSYLSGGILFPSNATSGLNVSFKTADCSGDAYIPAGGGFPQWYLDFITDSLAGMNRIVFRSVGQFGFGVPRAWVGNLTFEEVPIATNLFKLDDTTGACVPGEQGFNGTLLGLDEVTVPTPYDFQGPLEVR